MRNDNKKDRFPAGSQHSSQQDPCAGNRFEEELNRFKARFDVRPGHGSDTELAKKLGLTREAIGGWKQKKQIPAKWRVREENPIYKTRLLDEDSLRKAILIVEKTMVETETYYIEPIKKTELILMIYDILLETKDKEIPKSMVIKLIKLAA